LKWSVELLVFCDFLLWLLRLGRPSLQSHSFTQFYHFKDEAKMSLLYSAAIGWISKVHLILIGWDPAPPPPPHLGSYTRALLVSPDWRHLFVSPCLQLFPDVEMGPNINLICSLSFYFSMMCQMKEMFLFLTGTRKFSVEMISTLYSLLLFAAFHLWLSWNQISSLSFIISRMCQRKRKELSLFLLGLKWYVGWFGVGWARFA
jgi:hypothetical protein